VLGKGFTGYPTPGKPSNKLKLAYVEPVPRSECQDEWRQVQSNYVLTQYVLCAVPINGISCYGDSGGPLLCNEELTGVVSFGRSCDINDDPPEVFSEVYFFNDWIDSVMNDN
jgi:trypsin